MGYGNFIQGNRTIQPKWLVKNENVLRFDLSIQRNEVWDHDRKSLYIRSMIYGYPVGSFYAQDNGDDNLWMLDGKQRFTTIIQYLKGSFALSENTPSINDIEIANLKFEELPDDFKDELKTRNLTLFTYKNMTEEERDNLFLFLNNGMALTKMELTRVVASSKIMNFINEISDYEFFQKNIAISDSQRNRYVDEEVILQIISVLMNGYNEGFSSKEMKNLALKLRENGIPENIQEIIRSTTEYLDQAIPVKEKNLKKVHVPMIFNLAVKAQTNEIEPSKFGGFVQEFFAHMPDEYFLATQSGSAKKENVKTRIDELNKYYDENIQSAPEFKMPEPVVRGTGKRGRPAKNQTIVVNPPGEPSSMAASASGSLS